MKRLFNRVRGLSRRASAAGAVTAQFSQALASFFVTVVALRGLDASTFGQLSLLLGGLIVATAVMTGLVGDSLTVLDRHNREVRAGLQVVCLGVTTAVLLLGAAVSHAADLLNTQQALVYGLAVCAFVVEDTIRRLLMANLAFWRVVVVDLSYLVVAVIWLALHSAFEGPLSLGAVIAAVLVGQCVAIAVGVRLLPREERRLVRQSSPDVRSVLAFGTWRALQQTLRPLSLTMVRVAVASALGAAALGGLEAARIYTSPLLLLVQGMGGFLLVSYARQRSAPLAQALRKADGAAAGLVAASVLLGAAAVVLLPALGGGLTGGEGLSRASIAAWSAYAAAVAATMPYASLAAVRGRQAVVLGLRAVDTALGVSLAVVGLHLGASGSFAPAALAVGSLVGAVLQREVARGRARGPAD